MLKLTQKEEKGEKENGYAIKARILNFSRILDKNPRSINDIQ